ncbi:MAG TPA: hypothetical protein VGD72_03180 [Mycobacteriales bacterium]
MLSGIAWGRRRVERGVEVLRHRAELRPPEPGDVLVEASTGPRGELIVLWAAPDVRDALMAGEVAQRTGARGAARTPGVRVRVTVHVDDWVQVIPLADVALSFPAPQLLPGGRILLVGAACEWRPGGPERNAAVYDGRGRLLTEATFGDGAQHVLTDGWGRVWVGYSEQGVAGNLGWGELGAPPPVGEPGLVRFGPGVDQVWRYEPHDGQPPIDDCYALNVTDAGVWAYFDPGFPLVRFGPEGIRAWRTRVKGATAIVIAGNTVALAGGYDHEHDRYVVGTLDDRSFVPHRELTLRLPGDIPLPDDPVMVGRGNRLHVVTATNWYTTDLVETAPGA